MEVAFMADITDPLMTPDRSLQIVKGKRTKRHRPSSPLCTSVNSGDCLIPDQSPVSSSEEDEDMENCLILLAQSVSPVNEHKYDEIRRKTEKLSSRRSTEICVYECKTCNRSFPSFQALGGHRASHKKPKLNVEEKQSSSVYIPPIPPPLTEYSDENEGMIVTNNVVKPPSPSRLVNFVQTGMKVTNNNIKVHECSICGSEFTSGQALGGHMRKHRLVPASVNGTESVTVTVTEKEKSTGSMSTLSLDLNFPPPPEMADDVVQSKFQFAVSSSQQHMVFCAPAVVVDCHY